ncbi:MAG: hypothetical protein EBS05_07255, partial [Proteobacteria bacterium]|nr:hypothetical protein [Pseudomonadota bacterium]
MKTNTFTATNEVKTAKVIPVRFAPEVAERIEVRKGISIAWIPRRPFVVPVTPRAGLSVVLALLVAFFASVSVKPAYAALTNASTDLAVLV